MFNRIKSDKRGFTLVELVATVAILAVLVTIAIVGVLANSVKLKEKEYDQNAEAIAVAAQSRLTALKNAGDTDKLAALGFTISEGSGTSSGTTDEKAKTQRFVSTDKTEDMDYILPPFSIDGSLREKDFVIGFSSTTAKVSEVFFFANGLPTDLSTKIEDLRKNKKSDVGYYKAAEEEVVNVQPAGAQLPTPQLSINNFENLQLDIYLPYVRQLPDIKLGFKVMLVGKDELPKEEDEAAKTIYETPTNVQLVPGNTYSLILDTPQEYLNGGLPTIANYNTTDLKNNIPTGRFSTWARLTSSYIGDSDLIDSTLKSTLNTPAYNITGGFKLGEDVKAIVKVYAMKNGEQDKMYVTRTASVVFNGWFQSLTERTVNKVKILCADISCGRHLQNLGRLTEIRDNLKDLLPTSVWDPVDKCYKDYNWNAGKAYSYTQSSSSTKDSKYLMRSNVNNEIVGAYQLMPIDFDNKEWYSDSGNINFEPIGTVKGFYYFGNYYPIRNLHVHTDLYAGLFSYTYQSKIYDVRLVNPSVRSDMPLVVSENFEMGVGGLIGTDRASDQIYNCQVYLEKINKSTNTDEKNYEYDESRRVVGNGYVGGLIGFAEDEEIRQCSASCYVGNKDADVNSPYVGGLIGGVTGNSNIKRCYAAGILRGEYVGGLLGAYIPDTDYSSDKLTIESCYTAGNIEFADVSAGGLIGYTEKEQRGYEKSAMRAHKNYCVVIYGIGKEVDNKLVYSWLKADEKNENDAKIYGTFDGDNFVWLYTGDDIVAEASKETDYYRILASAAYEEENYNYYVPQKGIEYAHSSLYMAEGYVDGIQEFIDKYYNKNSINVGTVDEDGTFSYDLKTLQDSVLKNNRLQVLEQIRQELLSIYEDVKNYVNSGKLVSELNNYEVIKIDYHFDHKPQGTSSEYDGDKLYVSSHSPKAGDVRRNATIVDVITSLLFRGEGSGTETTPANDTALWYIDQLEGLLKGTTEVTIRTGTTKAPQNKTYTLNGTGVGKKDDFKALIQKFASFFFSDKNAHSSKYYWPNIGGSEENRGALSELFADIRRFFDNTYHTRSEMVYSYEDIYHSNGEIRDESFEIVGGNLKDKNRNAIIAYNFDSVDFTSFSNGKTDSSSNLLYYDTKTKKIALRDGYSYDSGNNLVYQKTTEDDPITLVKNFDFTKNFNADNYLIDEYGNKIVKIARNDNYYAMESFKDRVDNDILTMLYSLYHYGDSWQSGYIVQDMNDNLWERKDSEGNKYYGNARNIVDYSQKYISDINDVNYKSDELKLTVNSKLIFDQIKKIFGDDLSENRTNKLDGGLFGNIFDLLVNDELEPKDYNRITLRDNYKTLIDELNTLYKYFGKAKNYYEKINESKEDHMAELQGYCYNLISEVEKYSRMSYTGGIEEILAKLSDAVELYKNDSATLKQEINKYLPKIQIMLNTDSGHAIYATLDSAGKVNETSVLEQLQKLTMDTSDGANDGTFDRSDWYGYKHWDPKDYHDDAYKYNFNEGLYNTVFPYHEKGEAYTGVFPFPLIVGMDTHAVDGIGGSKVTKMLIHYGDWLTPDMWATPMDATLAVLNSIDTELNEMSESINQIITDKSSTTGNLDKQLETFSTNINTVSQKVTDLVDNLKNNKNPSEILSQTHNLLEGSSSTNDDGFIKTLETFKTKCEEYNKQAKQETVKKIISQVEDLITKLNNLLSQIDILIGTSTNTAA